MVRPYAQLSPAHEGGDSAVARTAPIRDGFPFFVPPTNYSMTQIELQYAKMPLRVLVSPEGVWFCCKDLYAAHGRQTDRAALAHFDPVHLKLATFTSDAGPVRLTAVSPLGVATIAESLSYHEGRILDAWVRKTSRRLGEEYGFSDLEMTQLANGRHPVKPHAYSEHSDAWYRLQIPTVLPRRANLHEPALYDDDPDLPPHDPAADIPELVAVRAAQERHAQADAASARNPLLRSILLSQSRIRATHY